MSSSFTYSPLKGTAIKPYFPALTGLRALAAWLIFFYHFNQFDRAGLPGRILNEFHIGVTLFFVLSGFLICSRYASHIQLSWPWLSSYVYRRFIRIYPLYLLLTCLVFVVHQLVPSYDSDGLYTTSHLPGKVLIILMNLTLLRSWFTHFRFTGIGAGWTLTVEECFYLLAPFLILVLRYRLSRLPVYIAGFIVIGCLLVALPAPWHPFGFMPSYSFMFSATFFGRCCEFLAGVSLALLWLRKAPILRWLSQRVACTAVGIAWVIGCLGLLVVDSAMLWGEQWVDWGRIAINNLVLVPGICLLLVGLINESTHLGRLLGSRPFGLFGKASYALYLIHAGVLDRFLTQHVTTNLPLRFVITNILAIALYKGIEHPLYRKLLPHGTRTPALKTKPQ